ncbi:MAG: Flp pilus assembly protein CpaB [Oligoflexia bacterium]|nr:Flp pilus assembly protein CpaB [Oligoflexia bacterium]
MAVRVQSARALRPRVLPQLVAALGVGVALAVAAFQLRPAVVVSPKSESAPVVVGEFDTVTVPVPVSFVPAGTKVRDIRLKQVAFPKHQLPESALVSIQPVLEGVTVAGLPANLPLFRENFSLIATAQNPVVERIPPGMRAMTVRVDATSAVEGWAGSGAIVDVLLVEKDRTTVIAERVKILSAERSVAPVDGSSAPNVPNTVTLLVTQEQCLAINTASPRGRLAFALRSLSDEDAWHETLYTADRLHGGRSAVESKANINGYVSVQRSQKTDSFALANGKWVRTDSVPEGFLVARE